MIRANDEVVLIDFGLSKQYMESGEPESSTRVGSGTSGYAPIEQANYREGKDFPVTMDIYALGATLYKMLTGIRPMEASEILNEGFPAYELQQRGVCNELITCISKAMSPIKKNRYQSVTDSMISVTKFTVQENYNIVDSTEVTTIQPVVVHSTAQLALYKELDEDMEGLIVIKRVRNDLNVSIVKNQNDYNHSFSFSEGLMKIEQNEKYGYINEEGEIVIPCKYEDAGNFSEGAAPILLSVKFTDKEAYLNDKNNLYDDDKFMYKIFASFGEIPRWGYVNKEGKEVIPCIYQYAHNFSEGLACVEQNYKYGFINKEGRVVIPCIYDHVENFSDGLACVELNYKYGFINKRGEQIIPCIYNDASLWVSCGLVFLEIDKKWGCVSKEGNEVIPCIFDDVVEDFSEGLASIKMNGKWGYINKEGMK